MFLIKMYLLLKINAKSTISVGVFWIKYVLIPIFQKKLYMFFYQKI